MGYVVKMPKLGLEMEEGTLLEWYVDEGDTVEEGETLRPTIFSSSERDISA